MFETGVIIRSRLEANDPKFVLNISEFSVDKNNTIWASENIFIHNQENTKTVYKKQVPLSVRSCFG